MLCTCEAALSPISWRSLCLDVCIHRSLVRRSICGCGRESFCARCERLPAAAAAAARAAKSLMLRPPQATLPGTGLLYSTGNLQVANELVDQEPKSHVQGTSMQMQRIKLIRWTPSMDLAYANDHRITNRGMMIILRFQIDNQYTSGSSNPIIP